jgi:uncharacterized protein
VKLLSRDHYLWLALPVFLIISAEMLIFAGQMKAAMIVHALNVVLLISISLYIDNKIFAILMLLPLFRLLNAAMPVFFNLTLYSYPLVYAPMFLPIYLIMKEGILSRSEAGITFKDFWFYLPLALAVGFSLGWGEYNVLHPGMLLPNLDVKSILILCITMILFVGVVEEFVFRSALQTVLEARLGSVAGLLVASIIFGVMHSGYRLPQEILYVFFAGLVFGLLFRLSKSLPIIALAHGVTNISLFLVAPIDSGALVYLIGVPGLIFVLCAILYKRKPGEVGPEERKA